MSYFRTAILLAAMTALFMGIGFLIGGQAGMIIALLVAGAMNLFAYWNSDKMVLRMYGAREADARAAPELNDMVRRLAGEAGLPMPRVYIMENAQPNAFATGRNPNNAAVAVTTGLTNMVSKDELASVIAHELAHIKHHDTLLMTVTATIAGAISMLANFGCFFGGRSSDNGGIGFICSLALMILGVIAFVQGFIIGGMWWLLIGLFLRGAAATSYQQLLFHEFLHDQPIRRFMRRDPVTVPPSISVREWVEDYVYRHHFKMFPVVDGENLLGCISIEHIRKIPRDDWQNKTVREIMDPSSATNTVSANMQTEKLLATMIRPDTPSRYMVVDDDQLVGVISLKDLLELIALKLEVEKSGK